MSEYSKQIAFGVALAVIIGSALAAGVAYLPLGQSVNTTVPAGATTTTSSNRAQTRANSTLNHPTANCGSNLNQSSSEWLTFKDNPERTGYSHFNLSLPFQGKLVWQNRSLGMESELIVFNNELFTAEYYLHAINVTNGNQIWQEATGIGPAPTPSSDGNLVYMGSPGIGFYAFDPSNGNQPKQNEELGIPLGSAAIYGDCIFISSAYQFRTPSSPTSSIYALNKANLNVIWSYNLTSSSSYFYSTVSTDGSFVLAPLSNGSLFAFNASSGALQWKDVFPSATLSSSVAIWGGQVFLGASNGYVYALNEQNGDTVWKSNLNSSSSSVTSASPVIAYGRIYVPTANGLYSLYLNNGTVAWHSTLSNSPNDLSAPCITSDLVFISDEGGNMYALNANNGSIFWQYSSLGVGFVSEPIAAYGMIFVDGNNGVFAFR